MTERIWELVSGNVAAKLISVAIAIVLWVVVLGSRNVEVTKDVPVELIAPAGLVAGNEVPDKVSFRLAGPKAFLRGVLDRKEDPIRVNLSENGAGLVTFRFFADNIRVPIGVKVLSVHPTAVLIRLEPVKERDVPVRIQLRGSPQDGFRVAQTRLDPEVVRIKGPASRIEGITEVETTPIDLGDLSATLEREVSLELGKLGVQLVGTLPKARVEIERLSANYKIKDVEIRVISPYQSTVEPGMAQVYVRAASEALKLVDRTQVFAQVDAGGKGKGRHRLPVKVVLPRNIGFVKVVPEQVWVTIQ